MNEGGEERRMKEGGLERRGDWRGEGDEGGWIGKERGMKEDGEETGGGRGKENEIIVILKDLRLVNDTLEERRFIGTH